MNGPTALDYGPYMLQMERMQLSGDDYDDLFADIRVIEAAAIEAMHAKDD